jgi:hypothetical protein
VLLNRPNKQINAIEGLLETIRRQRSTTDEARLADAKDLIQMLEVRPTHELQVKRQQLQSAIKGLVDSIWILPLDSQNMEVQIFRKDYVACINTVDGVADWASSRQDKTFTSIAGNYDLRQYARKEVKASV